MSERVQPVSAVGSGAGEQVESLAPLEALRAPLPGVPAGANDRLKTLAARARATFGADRANDIAQLVREIDSLQPSEESAAALLDALASTELEGLLPADGGIDVRARAVGRLLELGYPWALSVDPADLEYFRDEVKRQGGPRWLKVLREGPIATITGPVAMLLGGAALAPLFTELPFPVPTGGALADGLAGGSLVLWGLLMLVANFAADRKRAVLGMAAMLPLMAGALAWLFTSIGAGAWSLVFLLAAATPLFVASLAAGLNLPSSPLSPQRRGEGGREATG